MSRNNELKLLHPVFRKKVKQLIKRLEDVNNPLRPFESYRPPERQHYLYAKGRTKPGSRVSNAKPWQSYHQYGVAVDFVLYINNRWSWETSGEYGEYWTQLHEIGLEIGVKPLSWEKPHLQLADIRLKDLQPLGTRKAGMQLGQITWKKP